MKSDRKMITQSVVPPSTLNRRTFLKHTGAVAAGIAVAPMIVPSRVFGANERVVLGFIGVGNQGRSLLNAFQRTCDIGAISDVFLPRAREVAEGVDVKNVYQDYRMLLEQKDIDAVVVATPLHWHALNCIHAAQAGKDIFCEKPLTHSIVEGRRVVQAVRKYERVLQTGIQGRLNRNAHTGITHVRNGTQGKVTRIIAENLSSPMELNFPEQEIPEGLDWDMWCGPAEKPPFNHIVWDNRSNPSWVSLRPFSGSSMTDWGSHGFDLAQWGLGMDESGPEEVWVEGEPFIPQISTPDNPGGRQSGPRSPKVFMKYPNGVILDFAGGVRWSEVQFICEDGTVNVTRDGFSANPNEKLRQRIENPEIQIYRGDEYVSRNNHLQDWLNCIKDRSRPGADVEIGQRTTSICHLANIARWTSAVTGETGQKLLWDAANERFTNSDEANRFLLSPQRKGYELPETV